MDTRTLSTDPKNVRRRFLALCKKIDKSNKAFERADRYGKIVLVAKDVLTLLDLRKIEACHGTYVRLDVPEETRFNPPKKFDNLLRLPNVPSCNVCAIGAAMVAATLRFDNVPTPKGSRAWWRDGGPEVLESADACYYDPDEPGSTTTSEDMSKQARKAFPNSLLRTMEEAFEQGFYGYGIVGAGDDRLRAIYQNLVNNDGRFTRYNDPYARVWPKSKAHGIAM